jgi:ElaB/YqjD/DUF883 family membrane-anchored ribosome-binding protein
VALLFCSCQKAEEKTAEVPLEKDSAASDKTGEPTSSSWEDLKTHAQGVVDSAKSLSLETWAEWKGKALEEWVDIRSTLGELQKQAEGAGQAISPRARELLDEANVLKLKMEQQLEVLQGASGEQWEKARATLDQTLEELRVKLEALKSAS